MPNSHEIALGKTVDPDVSPKDYFEMMRARLLASEDETGALSARPLLRGATGLVGERLREARNLGEAMRRCAETYNLLHGGSYNHVERRPGALVYRIDDHEFPFAFPPDDAARAAVMEGVQIFTHEMLSIWAGQDLAPFLRAVHSRRLRRAQDRMLGFWHAPVRTGAPAYLLEYRVEAEALAPAAGYRALFPLDVYDRILSRLTAQGNASEPGGLAARVSGQIETGVRQQDEVASRLGMSVATLRRRLEEEGRTFRALRVEALDRQARRHLSEGCTIERVADLLGFSDARSFSRAFKQWNGMTPAAFARRALSENVLPDCADPSSP